MWANLGRWTRNVDLSSRKREDYKTKLQESVDPRGFKLDPLCPFQGYIILSHPQPALMAKM